MTDKPINGVRGWSTLVSTVLAGMVGSGSGVYVYLQNIGEVQFQQIARPDPATGTELRRLYNEFRQHIENHPDSVHDFHARIARVEDKVDLILKKLD